MKGKGGWEINWSVCNLFRDIIATEMGNVEESNAVSIVTAETQVRLGIFMLNSVVAGSASPSPF